MAHADNNRQMRTTNGTCNKCDVCITTAQRAVLQIFVSIHCPYVVLIQPNVKYSLDPMQDQLRTLVPGTVYGKNGVHQS